MRKLYIRCSSLDIANKIAPWACKIIKVEGGYYCFESYYDFMTYNNSY